MLVLEKAPREWSGGNSAFTAGAMRVAHGGVEDRCATCVEDDPRLDATDLPPYSAEEFQADMRRVTLGRGDEAMARVLVGDSRDAIRWLHGRGIRFRLMYERQSYEADGRHRFWGGLAVGVVDGGRGLIDQHAAAAEAHGIEVRHDAAVEELVRRRASVRARRSTLRARSGRPGRGRLRVQPADARGATSGRTGTWRRCAARRTTPARCCSAALAAARSRTGNWSGCHAIQWDRDAPPTGDLELTNRFSRQSYPVGIVVNLDGERFIDEGADFRNYTYAKYGAEVLRQPSGVAFQVFDARSVPLLRTIDYEAPGATRVDADTLGELAAGWGSTPSGSSGPCASSTPRSCRATFDPAVKDGVRTEGLAVPKSNWALPIDAPPFTAFPITCGITFTFGGVRVDADARVLDLAGRPLPGLYAAGELVGGLFFHNYPGGIRADRGHGLRTPRRVRRRNYGIGRP